MVAGCGGLACLDRHPHDGLRRGADPHGDHVLAGVLLDLRVERLADGQQRVDGGQRHHVHHSDGKVDGAHLGHAEDAKVERFAARVDEPSVAECEAGDNEVRGGSDQRERATEQQRDVHRHHHL